MRAGVDVDDALALDLDRPVPAAAESLGGQ